MSSATFDSIMTAVVRHRVASGAVMGEYHARCMKQFVGLPVPELPFPEKYLLARDACIAGNLEILEDCLREISVNECDGELLVVACQTNREDVVRLVLCHQDLSLMTLAHAIKALDTHPSSYHPRTRQLVLARDADMRSVKEPLAKFPKMS